MKTKESISRLYRHFTIQALCFFAFIIITPLYAQTDDLDLAIREISSYLNQNIPSIHKVAFLNVVSSSVPLSEYILEELFANAINDKEIKVASWVQLNEARKQFNIKVNDDVPSDLVNSVGLAVDAQTIVTCKVTTLGDKYRITTSVKIAQTSQVYAQFNRNINASPTINALMRASNTTALATSPAYNSETTTITPSTSNQTVPIVPQKPFTFKYKDGPVDPLYFSNIIFASGNMNWVGGRETEDIGILLDYGFGFAGVYQRESSPIIGSIGFKYSRRGYTLSDFTYSLTYWDIIAKVKYDMYYDQTYVIHPYIGVSSAFLSKAMVKSTGDVYYQSDIFRDDDILCLLGVDVTINNLFVIGLEYNHGLIDITSPETGEYYSFRAPNSTRSRSLLLNIGINIERKPIDKKRWFW